MNLTQKEMDSAPVLRGPAQWQSAYYNYLYNYAQYKVGDAELVKDLIQDTFLDAMEGLGNFKEKSKEITWLTAILKYKIYKNYKSRLRKPIIYLSIDCLSALNVLTTEDDQDLVDRFTDPLDSKKFGMAIEDFINTLPEKWRKVYLLKYRLNKSTNEILHVLNLTESNYWVINHRLKNSLKDWYLTEWN